MKRIRALSSAPEHAATMTPDVIITVIINLLEAVMPLFTGKSPQNPLPPAETPEEGEATE